LFFIKYDFWNDQDVRLLQEQRERNAQPLKQSGE